MYFGSSGLTKASAAQEIEADFEKAKTFSSQHLGLEMKPVRGKLHVHQQVQGAGGIKLGPFYSINS